MNCQISMHNKQPYLLAAWWRLHATASELQDLGWQRIDHNGRPIRAGVCPVGSHCTATMKLFEKKVIGALCVPSPSVDYESLGCFKPIYPEHVLNSISKHPGHAGHVQQTVIPSRVS
ncbi:hypothetical protein VFPPC_18046 [Pochonia chlamydosporia 170]|uniref:Uncharacterized protein n=1 Tax=Pochonia chlamydosporia 170 TaxID=1380566 RepID=A0A219AQ05_METCM|nr:hypothetical protein VFPPC_18046 [Pochonia chlamydosporia 170]OWT42791.1 hypothetical protein VFPPC_18046 [Pochonia chlamydosporia 170]